MKNRKDGYLVDNCTFGLVTNVKPKLYIITSGQYNRNHPSHTKYAKSEMSQIDPKEIYSVHSRRSHSLMCVQKKNQNFELDTLANILVTKIYSD